MYRFLYNQGDMRRTCSSAQLQLAVELFTLYAHAALFILVHMPTIWVEECIAAKSSGSLFLQASGERCLVVVKIAKFSSRGAAPRTAARASALDLI